MSSSCESEDEEQILMKIKKSEEEIKLLRKKLKKKQHKKNDEAVKCKSTGNNQNAVPPTPLQAKKDECDDDSLLIMLTQMYASEDEDATSCDTDKRNTRFENNQKKKAQKLAKILSSAELTSDELGNTPCGEYTRTGGQCSTSGAMYEVKVLALLYVRATARNWDFLLGTNVEEAGKFDDVRLAYTTDSGLKKQLLVQLSHKETLSISKMHLLAEDKKKNKFSILKYYRSFCKLRENFSSNNVLNSYSQFRDIDFVVFTNAAAQASEVLFTNTDLVTADVSILNMNGKVFSFAQNQSFIQEFKTKYTTDIKNDCTVEEFFAQFYIFSDQTREENLEKQIKEEIKMSYFLSNYGVGKTCASLVEYIYSWWGDRTETYHLKRGDFPFQSGSDILNEYKVESPKLKFRTEALSPIKECLSNDSIQIVNCVVEVDICEPACDRLAQSITETSVKFLAVTLEYIESFCEKVMHVWPSKLCPILVIKYEFGMAVLQNITEISALVKKSLDLEKGSKLFLVSKQGDLGNKLFQEGQLSYTDLNVTCEINHLTDECKESVLQKVINFQGSNVSLHSVLGKSNARAVNAQLLTFLMYSDEILKLGLLQRIKPLYYIDRVLTCKHFLKKNVLQYSSRDIFAISGVDEEEMQILLDMEESNTEVERISSTLPDIEDEFAFKESYNFEYMGLWYSDGTLVDSTLTAGHLVIRNFLRQTATANYMEEPVFLQSKSNDESNTKTGTDYNRKNYHIIHNKDDFTKLCKKHKSKNVHWIKVQDAKLKWKESKGHWTAIKRNVSDQIEFIPINNVWDIPDRIVVITGSPGMGKSTLLAQVAVNSKEKRPETCVIRIDLRECGSDLINFDSTITPEKACSFLIESSMLLDEYHQSSTYCFFEHILKHTDRAVVLIDGFDEVYPENESTIINLIKSFLKLSISKLWITTQHHLTSRLEGITKTISYELQPLKISESETLVRQYLNNERGTLSRLKIKSHLLSRSLLENPLNCEMLAEAAQRNIDIRNVLLGNTISNEAIISTLVLLEAIVDKKFEIYFKKYKNSIPENTQIHEIPAMKKQFTEYHQWSALLHIISLGVIKPSGSFYIHKIKHNLKDFIDAVKTGSGITGMINTVRNEIPVFEHRIYCDYFLAQWMYKNCYGSNSYVTKTILQRIIFDPQFVSVVQLFNWMACRGFELHSAVLQNVWNSATLPKILTRNKVAGVNHKDEAGRTALHLALSLGNNNIENVLISLAEKKKRIIGELIRLGAKPDIKDDILGWTPFRYSNIRSVPWNIVAIMMKEKGISKSDMNVLIERVQTQKLDALAGLAHYVSFGNRRLVSFLLNCGVDVNDRVNEMGDTAIIIAAARGQYEMLQFLHSECSAKPELRNYNGDSPLHWACLRGHMSIVKYLINKCKIDTNIKNNSLYTPLLAAARGGHLNIVRYLMDKHSSDPRERTKFGQSALCLAAGCEGDDVGTVKYFVEEHGMNPTGCEEFSCLPANIACKKGNVNITKFFVDKCGINLYERTEHGVCSLHLLILFLHVQRVKEFVRMLKLSLDVTDNHGRTLFMWSLKSPNQDMCEYLRRKCTNIEDTDKEGNTALHFYILYSNKVIIVEIVKWLVETCYIDPNVVNFNGLTALQCAVSRFENPLTKHFILPEVIDYLQTK